MDVKLCSQHQGVFQRNNMWAYLGKEWLCGKMTWSQYDEKVVSLMNVVPVPSAIWNWKGNKVAITDIIIPVGSQATLQVIVVQGLIVI